MKEIPLYIPIVFISTVAATAWFFFRATGNSVKVLVISAGWLILQSLIALSGFYTVTNTIPPRLLFLVAPALIGIIILFSSPHGRNFIDKLDSSQLVLLHTVRVPVELVLYWLFLCGKVPALITFEGSNFDIISGITAIPVAWFGYNKQVLPKWLLLAWNLACLFLLLNVVIHAILSAPFPFQQFAFDQPTVAVLYFPYVLLPGFIVPIVLLSHLVCIRQLIRKT